MGFCNCRWVQAEGRRIQNWGGKPGSAAITEVQSRHLSALSTALLAADYFDIVECQPCRASTHHIEQNALRWNLLQALPLFLAALLDRLQACSVFSAAERPNHCLVNSYERGAPCPMHQDGPLCELSIATAYACLLHAQPFPELLRCCPLLQGPSSCRCC